MRGFCLAGLAAAAVLGLGSCGELDAAPGTAAAADAAKPAPFQVERSAVHPLKSASLGRTYDVYVKTPPGYDKPENADRRYPVLYLADGPYAFQVASGVTRVPFNQGKLEEFILVGLSYAQGEDAAASRRRDYTPYVDAGYDTQTGHAAAYVAHIEREVIPLVEAAYRADPARRVFSGQSLGGLLGLWMVLTKPELFDTYVLTSPSIWWSGHALTRTETAYAAAHKDLKATVYLATGEQERPGGCAGCTIDMVGDQEAMVRRLEARNYPGLRIRSEIVPGAIHEMTYPIALTRALQWLYYDEAAGRGRQGAGLTDGE